MLTETRDVNLNFPSSCRVTDTKSCRLTIHAVTSEPACTEAWSYSWREFHYMQKTSQFLWKSLYSCVGTYHKNLRLLGQDTCYLTMLTSVFSWRVNVRSFSVSARREMPGKVSSVGELVSGRKKGKKRRGDGNERRKNKNFKSNFLRHI